MTKLTADIKRLEQEIAQNRQAAYLQFKHTKTQLKGKLTSPPIFLVAFVTGGLLGKQFKRSLKKQRPLLRANSRAKLSILQKIAALSSEISLAINLFHRLKNMVTHLTQKKDSTATITH